MFDNQKNQITPFEKRIWLSSPTMHGEELKYIREAFETNWLSTLGKNIDEIERITAELTGAYEAVALSSGTSALHLAIRLCGEKLYGQPRTPEQGTLAGHKVFCSDMTFSATVNPVCYENGECIFIDTERDSWNMDPDALNKAFELYPDVKLIVIAHLYGTPGKIDEIRKIADEHGALIVEDAAESFSATLHGKQTGTFGDIGVISFNGNKLITGSTGGMVLCKSEEDAEKMRKWSTQSREDAPWYQHDEIGYNYRMSNLVAGVIRGQLSYLDEHRALKKAIYERYKEGFKELPVSMNPYLPDSEPNFWLSCILIDKKYMTKTSRDESKAVYVPQKGKSCPTEILETLDSFNAMGRPIWKPMHMQPIYRSNPFVTIEGSGRARTDAYRPGKYKDVGADIFDRGLCLPCDIKMTSEQQDKVIEIVRSCFN